MLVQENTSRTLRLAHLYLFDHLLQTLFTLHFAYIYYYATPHDGRRIINSQAQQDLIDLAISRGEVPAEREYDVKLVAEGLWRQERTTAAVCLVGIWSIKVSDNEDEDDHDDDDDEEEEERREKEERTTRSSVHVLFA